MNDQPPSMVKLSKKVCLLGDFAVGKTSLVRRFVYNLFDDKYISTIGVKVSRKTVAVQRDDEVVELAMMLWDLAGSEEFDRVRASYLRGASGAVFVCDLTRPETIDSVQQYVKELHAASPAAHLIVAASKLDLVESSSVNSLTPVGQEQAQAAAASLGAACYLTSAKTGKDVETMFRHLGRQLVKRNP
jgi:small GTP-binding protein